MEASQPPHRCPPCNRSLDPASSILPSLQCLLQSVLFCFPNHASFSSLFVLVSLLPMDTMTSLFPGFSTKSQFSAHHSCLYSRSRLLSPWPSWIQPFPKLVHPLLHCSKYLHHQPIFWETLAPPLTHAFHPTSPRSWFIYTS